jgi:pyridoxal phosphate enzyme (YggS family)
MEVNMSIAENFAQVRQQVAEAARRSGRAPEDITIVAVSKTVGLEQVEEAIAAGVTDFGENRPDQLMEKHDAFPEVRWHFIGNIQSRRIKDIVGRATLVHSLDRVEHLERFEQRAAAAGIVVPLLIEVNVSGEASKSGFTPAEVASVLDGFGNYPHLRAHGLMTMAPQGMPDAIRRSFSGLRELRDALRPRFGGNVSLDELSMGMSEDFAVGIEEGATIVRIGRSIFSEGFISV